MSSYVHLGHVINSDLSDKDDIMRKGCTFVGQVNNVQCYFPTLAADVRYKLFRSYCSSIYGCELWHLNDSNINSVCTAWHPPQDLSYSLHEAGGGNDWWNRFNPVRNFNRFLAHQLANVGSSHRCRYQRCTIQSEAVSLP